MSPVCFWLTTKHWYFPQNLKMVLKVLQPLTTFLHCTENLRRHSKRVLKMFSWWWHQLTTFTVSQDNDLGIPALHESVTRGLGRFCLSLTWLNAGYAALITSWFRKNLTQCIISSWIQGRKRINSSVKQERRKKRSSWKAGKNPPTRWPQGDPQCSSQPVGKGNQVIRTVLKRKGGSQLLGKNDVTFSGYVFSLVQAGSGKVFTSNGSHQFCPRDRMYETPIAATHWVDLPDTRQMRRYTSQVSTCGARLLWINKPAFSKTQCEV